MKQHIARLTSGILAILLFLAVVPGNAKAEASAENLFAEAVHSLTDAYGVFEKAQTGTMSRPEDEWFAPGGVISATVLDFDSDGKTEMLVFIAQSSHLDSYQITMQMYEIQNNKAVAVATAPFGCPYGNYEMKLARRVFTLDRNEYSAVQKPRIRRKGNHCSGEMETGPQRSYNVAMRFAQIHYGRSVYDPVQRDSAIARHESQSNEHRS